jgi:hypothetical protein
VSPRYRPTTTSSQSVNQSAISQRVSNTKMKRKLALGNKLNKFIRTTSPNNNNGWIKNLSSRPLTTAEQDVLIKGLNFNVRDAPQKEYLASLEHALKTTGITEEAQQQIRQVVVPAITRNRNSQVISKQEQEALKSLQHDQDIIILPADKGRMTVILDKPDYIEKAKQLLSDTTTYQRIDRDPT